jgi:hypothetical protein
MVGTLFNLKIDTSKLKVSVADTFKFQLLESITHNAPQGIVQNESIGSDGGTTINTGRKIESLTLTGKLLNHIIASYSKESGTTVRVIENYSRIRDRLEYIKINSLPVELLGHPFYRFRTRKWIIHNINTSLNSGQNYLVFTISLKEYRQANIKTEAVNLVNTTASLGFVQRLTEGSQCD